MFKVGDTVYSKLTPKEPKRVIAVEGDYIFATWQHGLRPGTRAYRVDELLPPPPTVVLTEYRIEYPWGLGAPARLDNALRHKVLTSYPDAPVVKITKLSDGSWHIEKVE